MAMNIIVLDVDGVLNVAVSDVGAGAVTIDAGNLEVARRTVQSGTSPDAQVASRIISAAEHSLEAVGESTGSTYAKFIADDERSVSDILVGRLAKLIQMAGNNRMVVLSSTWRRVQCSQLVRSLEKGISEQLGMPFSFDAMTARTAERRPLDRLDTIGSYLEKYVGESHSQSGGYRVLVLDDLFATSMSEIPECSSVEKAATRIRNWMPTAASVSVKLVHTYDEWDLSNGDNVQVGAGLTMKHYAEAAEFLSEGAVRQHHVKSTSTSETPRHSEFLVRRRVSL